MYIVQKTISHLYVRIGVFLSKTLFCCRAAPSTVTVTHTITSPSMRRIPSSHAESGRRTPRRMRRPPMTRPRRRVAFAWSADYRAAFLNLDMEVFSFCWSLPLGTHSARPSGRPTSGKVERTIDWFWRRLGDATVRSRASPQASDCGHNLHVIYHH